MDHHTNNFGQLQIDNKNLSNIKQKISHDQQKLQRGRIIKRKRMVKDINFYMQKEKLLGQFLQVYKWRISFYISVIFQMKSAKLRTLIALKEPINKSPGIPLLMSLSKPKGQNGFGKILKEVKTKDSKKVVYQIKENMPFKKSNILWSFQIECQEERDKTVTIRRDILEKKMKEAKEPEPQPVRQESPVITIFQDSYNEESFRNQRFGTPVMQSSRKKDEPIVISHFQRNRSESSEKIFEESEEEQSLRRGKGRPKGSKNKAKNQKQPSSFSELKNHLDKRYQYGQYDTPKSRQVVVTPKREVKIEEDLRIIEQVFSRQKRAKGRPKGAKNKLKSEIQNQDQSESQQNQEYVLPLQITENVESLPCCFQCNNRKFKQSLIMNPLKNYKKILSATTTNPCNLWQDVAPQNRANVFLNCLKTNIGIQSFQSLLQKLSTFQPYFIPSWDWEGKIEDISFTIKTNKHFLSQTGKQGNYALLHDCIAKPGVWWKQIGVKRIIQAITPDTNKRIIDCLRSHDIQLAKQLQTSIPSFIRCGNLEIAKYLISTTPNHKFSKDHVEALELHSMVGQFKKSSLIKTSSGPNFLSPIHILAINPNFHLLQNALKILKEYNINDSLSRKPIHYAAIAKEITNMEILVKYQSDLKQTDKNRITPLMLAAIHGKPKNLAYIMSMVPEAMYLNFRCKDGLSALHYAILYEQLECIKILLANQFIDVELETRDKMTPLHLAAGVGNINILRTIIDMRHPLIDSIDRYKRTPLFFSIRNNNHQISYQLLRQGAKYYKKDSSMNSLLHYCSAYGNTLFLQYLLPHVKLNKNRDRFYPWEISVGKGHIGCMKLLQKQERRMDDGPPDYNMCFLNMSRIRYTPQSMQIMNILIDQYYKVQDVDINGSRLLHILCSIREIEYIKNRQAETGRYSRKYEKIYSEEYENMQKELINKLQSKGSCADVQNKNQETPISLCIQRQNMTGVKLLMKDRLNFEFESTRGFTILHYLSKLASQSVEGMKFTISKLQVSDNKKDQQRNKLKDALTKVDRNGFSSILLFVKDFTNNVKNNFDKNVKKLKEKGGVEASNAEGIAFEEFKEHQQLFMKLIQLIVDLGCDANTVVSEKRKGEGDEINEKAGWGVQHFLMKFPSVVLLKFFKNIIKFKDVVTTLLKQTPLHLFCQWNKIDCFFETEFGLNHKDYRGDEAIQFLLKFGFNPNLKDENHSTPLLYAALNKQIKFMIFLKKSGAQINIVNVFNQVPFIQIIKMKNHFTIAQIRQLLVIGADPNFEDLKKQTALHHLVYHSVNLDNSVKLCKLFFQYAAKINSLDMYERSPLFYCFTNINIDDKIENVHDKVEILQTLLKQPGIDINHKDIFKKTALHYACQKNYFFSLLHLLDREREKKIQLNPKDIDGNTPLALSLINKTVNQAAMIIRKGVTQGYVTDADQKKYTYFGYSADKLSLDVCFMFLDYGYPLQKAIQDTSNPTIKKLLEKRQPKKKTCP